MKLMAQAPVRGLKLSGLVTVSKVLVPVTKRTDATEVLSLSTLVNTRILSGAGAFPGNKRH